MNQKVETKDQPSKTKVMFTPDAGKWQEMKVTAVCKGYKSAQELLEEIMSDWLAVNGVKIADAKSV